MMDYFDALLAKVLGWCLWILAFALCGVVIFRYGFGIGATWLSELAAWLMVCVCMLGMSFTLHQDKHVRLDIFYCQFSQRQKDMINSLGHCFFVLPFCVFVVVNSFDFVSQSWQLQESSAEAGGLPGLFIAKTMILLGPALLFIRAASLITKSIQSLKSSP